MFQGRVVFDSGRNRNGKKVVMNNVKVAMALLYSGGLSE
jgi:hypothetical protein